MDGVDHEVGVEVICIDVRCHQDFTAWEEPLRHLQRDLVGLRRGDVLLGREGLNVLVEEGPAGFAVQIFGDHKGLLCQFGRAVDAGEIVSAICTQRLLILGHVADDACHGPSRLLGLLNEAARRHGIPPHFG